VRETDEVKLLTEVCRVIVSQVAFKQVWVGMTDPDGWVRKVAVSDPDSAYLRNIKVSTDDGLPEGRGPMGAAIREGTPKIVNYFLDDTNSMPWHPMAAKENINAAAAFPLMRGGRSSGAIAVYSEEQNYFTPDLIELMRGLTDDLSYALDNFDREKLRLKAEHELRIAAAFESQEGIIVTDADNNILRVNKSFTALTGYSADEVVGKPAGILKSGRQDKAFYAAMWECIHRDNYWQGEIWNKRKNGDVYPEWLCITAITNPEGLISNYVGTFTDIIALYGKQLMASWGSDGEQWRSTVGYVAPDQGAAELRPAIEMFYVDNTIGQVNGSKDMMVTGSLGYRKGFLGHESRLGRAMGPTGVEFSNPLGYLNPNFNRRLTAWEVGELVNFRFIHKTLPNSGREETLETASLSWPIIQNRQPDRRPACGRRRYQSQSGATWR
jgi:PAS domain S-box-containing protein